jgi:hypothetical protein
MYRPTIEYIRPRGHPFKDRTHYSAIHLSFLRIRESPCNSPYTVLSPGRRVLRTPKRPEPVNHCLPSLMRLARTIELQLTTPTYSKSTLRGNPGCAVGPKPRQLARQVGGVSSIQASSMAITFLHKIVFRPGSTFCFGTISAVADEAGTLHRIADPTKRRSSSKISVKIGEKQEKAQPPMLRKRSPPARRRPEAHQPEKLHCLLLRRKNGHKSQERKRQIKSGESKLFFPRLQRRTERRSSQQLYHSTPTSSSSGEQSRPPSPTTSRPYPERNPLSGSPANEGTDAEISGDITRLESGTRRSLCRGTTPQRWEKPRKSVSSGKEGIPDDAIVGELRNMPNRKLSNVGKILSSGAT